MRRRQMRIHFNEMQFVSLYRCVVALWLVEQLTSQQATKNLTPQQSLLLLDLLQDAFVLLRATRQIWQHLVNWTVWNIFVSRVASLT